MATDGGPNIEKDGLVFGMDTGYGVANNSTATRFYRGEPTTNLKSSTQTNGSINGMQGVGVTYIGEEDGWKKFSLSGTFNAGTYPYCMYLSSQQCLAGQRYSTQAIIKTNVKDKFNYFGSNGVSYVNQPKNHEGVNSSTVLPDGSQLLQRQGFEYTSTTTQSGYLWTNPINGTTFNSSTDFVYLKDFQIEQNIHCTPFVNDVRTSTQSLIDLTKSTNIDASNVSFGSNGQPSYDETDDHITGVLPMNGLGAAHTIEMIFSCSVNQGSIGGRKDPFSIGNSSVHQYSALDVNTGNMNWYFYGKDTSFTNSPLMVADQFYHIVLSYAGGYSNNTNKKVWINGVQQTLSSGVNETPLMPNNPNFSVGRDRGRNTAYWPGEIPVFKVYSRALSEDQAQGNYNAYKNRFDL